MLGIVSQLAGCAVSNIEELSTLKAMGSEDKEKEKVLSREDKNFQKLQTAIREQKIKTGLSTAETVREWGEPVVTSREGNEERWVYKSKAGDWFKGEKIYLFFTADHSLKEWECLPTACHGND